MYIYTEARRFFDRPHPARARPGVTYARTPVHYRPDLVIIGSVVIGCAVSAAVRVNVIFILI